MRQFTLVLLLLLGFSFSGKGQTVEVIADIKNSTSACDSSIKLFQIRWKTEAADSLVWSKQDTTCRLDVVFPLVSGNYILRVISSEYGKAELSFQVNANNTYLDLGSVILGDNATQLEDVTITGVPKKFIQIDAEKTTVTVENNPILEVSSIYDAILKIPGIVPYPGGGFALGGQLASIYFEGIPSSLSTTDLENLLKSLPATSVQKIELISNPGASYDANVSGSIIDIISQGRVTKWISGTVTLNSGFNYNQKYAPSFLLSGKGKTYTWQLQTGYSNFERTTRYRSDRNYRYFDTMPVLTSSRKEQTIDQNFYFKPSFTYKINKNSSLQLNLGANRFVNDLSGSGSSVNPTETLLSDFVRKGKGGSFEAGFKYRLTLDTLKRKIEISSNYNTILYTSNRLVTQTVQTTDYTLLRNESNSGRLISRIDAEIPFPKLKFQLDAGAKWTYYSILSKGSYRLNDTSKLSLSSDIFDFDVPFYYTESNAAGYLELKKRFGKKLSVTAGVRAEDFRLNGRVNSYQLVNQHYFNLFPSVYGLYKITNDILFTTSYSRKINLPGSGQFDPNLTGYYDAFTQSTGNSNLKPNFFHRANAKLTIFDYCQISVDYSLSNSINLGEVSADSNSYTINQTYRTYNNVQSWSTFFALPIPFGLFTSGLDFFNQNIDVDAISFVYLYTENNKTIIPNYNYVNGNKSLWTYGAYSQIMLPRKVRLNIEYNFTATGMYQITENSKPIHELEVVLSREFFDKKWRASFTVQDIFNSNRTYNTISYAPLQIYSYYKQDTRIVWFKIAYSFGKYERPANNEEIIPSRGGN